MLKNIVVFETGATPKIVKRHHSRLMRESFIYAGGRYHARYMALHFTTAGAAKYGYRPRAGERSGIGSRAFFRSYTGRKQREQKHVRPLVWSGVSETLARIRDVRATKTTGRIVQHARGLNRRNPNSEINMVDEIRSVAADEAAEVAADFGGHYVKRLKEIRTRRRLNL